MVRTPGQTPVNEHDAFMVKVTTEIDVMAMVIKALAPLPEHKQRAVLRAVVAYFREDADRPGRD